MSNLREVSELQADFVSDNITNLRAELADNYKCKPFFHELPQSTIDQMIKDGKTLQYVMDNYRQPEWCKYPNALNDKMGCWSLVCMRTDISREFCEDCDCYNK